MMYGKQSSKPATSKDSFSSSLSTSIIVNEMKDIGEELKEISEILIGEKIGDLNLQFPMQHQWKPYETHSLELETQELDKQRAKLSSGQPKRYWLQYKQSERLVIKKKKIKDLTSSSTLYVRSWRIDPNWINLNCP